MKWLYSAFLVLTWFILACAFPGIVVGLTIFVVATNLVRHTIFE